MIVYQILNKINGKSYVGMTKHSLEKRWKEHVYAACTQKLAKHLHFSIQKYGPESFELKVLDTAQTREELSKKEYEWITKLGCMHPNGYNLTCGGDNTSELAGVILQKIVYGKIKPYSLLSPDGKLYEGQHLYAFCKEMGLNSAKMVEVLNHKRFSSKGWRASDRPVRPKVKPTWITHEHMMKMVSARTQESIEKSKQIKAKNRALGLHKKCGRKFMSEEEKIKISNILAKACTLVSPSGEVVEVTNFSSFGKKMGWGRSSVSRLASGKRHSLHGWTLASPKLDNDLTGSGD